MNWSDALTETGPSRAQDHDAVREVKQPLAASMVLHLAVVGILVALSLGAPAQPEDPADVVPIELRETLPVPPAEPPPALRQQPRAPRQAVPLPPPPSSQELRMKGSDAGGAKAQSQPKLAPSAPPDQAKKPDGRTAGGQMGGPLPVPTPGFPDDARGGETSQDQSIESRLRNFRKAVERQGVPAPGGPRGGGSGSGGIDMPDLPPTGFGVGNFEFESRDYDWGNYYRAIYWPILREWYARLYLTAGSFEKWAASVRSTMLDHQVKIRFTIQASGEVTGVMVELPSGCQPLDQSATDALRAVVLPKLPADFPRSSETVHARFLMEGDTRAIEAGLEPYLRAWGMLGGR
jgi:TonB family protein